MQTFEGSDSDELSGHGDHDDDDGSPINFYISDSDDDYDSASTTIGPEPRPRWCDVDESEVEEDEGMQPLEYSDADELSEDEDGDDDDAAAGRYWASSQHASRRTENPISCSRPSSGRSTYCPWRHLSLVLGWEEQTQDREAVANEVTTQRVRINIITQRAYRRAG